MIEHKDKVTQVTVNDDAVLRYCMCACVLCIKPTNKEHMNINYNDIRIDVPRVTSYA